MLDQLVESRSNKQASRRSMSFLVLFGVAIISVLFFAYLWSLIVKANDAMLSGDDLELSTLVAPVPLPDEAPPPVEKQPEKKQEDDLPTRKENIARLDESPPEVPPKTSTEKLTSKARPEGVFKMGTNDAGESTAPNAGPSRVEGGPGTGGPVGPIGPVESEDKDAPPVMEKPKPVVPKIVSKGVINGSAISLPKPPFPPTAKAVGASGAVSVQVTIDEAGNVISAVATSGHPLLKPVAAQAARSAKFRPTLLSGVPVKVSGIIVYNFTQ
jgi:periplasmic protein TonB